MKFDNEKAMCIRKLNTLDKSKKGSVDEQILPLIKLINSHHDYYTTSSCAGRIQLASQSKGKKYETKWLLSTHEQVTLPEMKKVLSIIPEETIWLKMEPPILHIAARDMDAADILLKFANESGFRRSSVLSFRKRIIIEIMIPERMESPVSENGKMVIDDDYLRILIKYANQRLSETRKRLEKFEKKFLSLKQDNNQD